MGDKLQHQQGVKIEYYVGIDLMKINMDGADGNFFAKLNEIIINPKIVDLGNLEIKKNGVKMDFTAPVICNVDGEELPGSMMLGVKFEGVDKKAFNEQIEGLVSRLGEKWEEAVRKRKKQILSRNEHNNR